MERFAPANESQTIQQLLNLQKAVKPLLDKSQRLGNEIKNYEEQLSTLKLQFPGDDKAIREYRCVEMVNKEICQHISQKSKEKALVDGDVHLYLEPYAKGSCRRLCEKVRYMLPREVRDIVYDCIHADDTIYVGPEYMHNTNEPCESDRSAHYWDAEYVGKNVKLEIVENWYRTTLFYFYDKANNAHVVDQFLVNDRWNLGLKPHDLIRKVQFNLGVSESVLHCQAHCCKVRGLADTLTRPLKNMDRLPNHVHFFIRIHTYRALEFGCLGGEELRETIGVLVSDLKTLHSAGHKFVVQWSEFQNLEFCSKTCGYSSEAWLRQLEDATRQVRQG